MFNLDKQNKSQDLLLVELDHFDIHLNSGKFTLIIGDEELKDLTLKESISCINGGIKELKSILFVHWNDLKHLSSLICNFKSPDNDPPDGLCNTVFLHSVRKSFLLSRIFTELKETTEAVLHIFNCDIDNISKDLIVKFNKKYLEIKIVHRMVMNELYKLKLLSHFGKLNKYARILGPLDGADLPLSERMSPWAGEEEYFDSRTRARKEQPRYNPEVGVSGFYYVWQDRSRDPYRFEDMATDSPYPSRSLMLIP